MGVGGWVVLSLCAGCQPNPDAPPIFRDGQEYEAALNEVRDLTKGPFEAMHEGFPVSEREIGDLKKADRLIDGMIAYNAANYAPYILKGLTNRALGKTEAAKNAYLQGIALAPKEPTGNDIGAIARIYDELGTLLFEQHEYQESEPYGDKAAAMLPDDPSILTNTASTKIELKKVDEARALLAKALKVDPTYDRAVRLKKLIDMGSKPK